MKVGVLCSDPSLGNPSAYDDTGRLELSRLTSVAPSRAAQSFRAPACQAEAEHARWRAVRPADRGM